MEHQDRRGAVHVVTPESATYAQPSSRRTAQSARVGPTAATYAHVWRVAYRYVNASSTVYVQV